MTTPWCNLIHFECFHLKVIGAASKEKLDVIREMGASATIDYKNENIREKVDRHVDSVYWHKTETSLRTKQNYQVLMLVIN